MARTPLATNFTAYLVSSSVNRAMPFLLLPILTRHMTQDDFATMDVFRNLIVIGSAVVGMHLQTNVTRRYFQDNAEDFGRLLSSILLVLVTSVAVSLVVLSGALRIFGGFLDLPLPLIAAIPVYSGISTLLQCALALIRNQGRPGLFSAFELGQSALNFGLAYVLVVNLQMGWRGGVSALVVSLGVAASFGLIHLLRSYRVRVRHARERVREVLSVSLPMIPHALATTVIAYSDRLFVIHYWGKPTAAVYVAANTIAMVIPLIADAFNRAWSPWMYRELAHFDPEKARAIVRATYRFVAAMAGLCLFVALIGPSVQSWLTPAEYATGWQIFAWFAFAYFLSACYLVVFPYLVHTGKTRFLALSSPAAAALNIALNFVLIPRFGILGAAQATAAAYGLSFLAVWLYGQKVHPMPWFGQRA